MPGIKNFEYENVATKGSVRVYGQKKLIQDNGKGNNCNDSC